MKFISLLKCVFVILILPTPLAAQELLESYVAFIAPEDRRNSKGVKLTHLSAVLAQDRANFHRFGIRQARDTADGVFTTTQKRSQIPNLVAAGSMTPEARAVLQGQGNGTLKVDIMGSAGRPTSLRVSVVGAQVPVQSNTASGIPRFGVTTSAPPPARIGQWSFRMGPAEWRAIAEVGVTDHARVSLECTRPGVDPSRHPDPGSIRPHEPGFLTLILTGEDFQGQGRDANIGIAIDGRSFGEAPFAQIKTSREMATNVPRDHALIAQLRGGLVLRLDLNSSRINVPLVGASMAIGRLLAVCEQPVDATTANANLEFAIPGSPTFQIPGAVPGGTIGADRLSRIDGRVAFWVGTAHPGSFIGTSLENTEHDNLLSLGLLYAALNAASDDLGASLANTPSEQHLRGLFQMLPQIDQRRIGEMIATLLDRPQAERNVCLRATGNKIWHCAINQNLTEFDRRRVIALLAREIATIATAGALPDPLPVYVICGGSALDQAYDFDTGEIRWSRFVDPGACRQANMPLAYMVNGLPIDIDLEFKLEEVMPERTVVPADDVERMVKQNQPIIGSTGEKLYRTHAIVFPAEVRVVQRDGPPDQLGLNPVSVIFSRTGAVDLRWTGAPEQVVMSLGGAQRANEQDSAEPLLAAPTISGLLANAPVLDTVAMTDHVTSLIQGDYAGDMRRFSLPAFNNGEVLVINQMLSQSEAVQRLATTIGAPPDFVTWTQILSHDGNVPDQEVMLILPRAFSDLISSDIPEGLGNAANPSFQLLVEIGEIVQATGEVGPSLVALARPIEFVATVRDDFNRSIELGRIALAPISTKPPTRLFMPDANWFLLRRADLTGQDPDVVFREAYETAGIGGNDTFARLDAIDAGLETAKRAHSAKDTDPWVQATLSLGAYDLEHEAYPISHLRLEYPVSDSGLRSLAKFALPEVQWRGQMLPIAIDIAREMRESLRADANYPARLRLATKPATADGTPPQYVVAEVLILPMPMGSQPVREQNAFVPDNILLRVEPIAGP